MNLRSVSLRWSGAPPLEQRLAGAIAMVQHGTTRSAACAEHAIWPCTLRRRLARNASGASTREIRLDLAVGCVLLGVSRIAASKRYHVSRELLRARLAAVEVRA